MIRLGRFTGRTMETGDKKKGVGRQGSSRGSHVGMECRKEPNNI